MDVKHQEITIRQPNGKTLTIKLYWDADIFEWIHTFRTILKWLTFSDGLINDKFPEEEEE